MKIINLLEIVLKGGHGSGNFGHLGRQGQVGGSRSSGSVIHPSDSGGSYSFVTNRYNIYKNEIEAVATDLGFDPNKIKFDPNPYMFDLGGESVSAAATYNEVLGVITIYPAFINSLDFAGKEASKILRGLLTHEITHSKFKAYRDRLEKQREKISRITKREKKNNVPLEERLLKSDGTINLEKDKKKYPDFELDQKLRKAIHNAPYEENGRSRISMDAADVSDYAHRWWLAADENGRVESAVNETFAEISRRRSEDSNVKIPASWEGLYNDFINLKG